MKRFLFIGLIVIAIAIAVGWAFSLDPFRHQPPEPTVTIEDREVKVYRGNYSWSGMFRGETADAKAEAVDLVKGDPSTRANPEDRLTIRFEDGPAPKSVAIVLWSVKDHKEMKTYKKIERITVPSTPGKYVYQIKADWKEGDGDFAFPIDVK